MTEPMFVTTTPQVEAARLAEVAAGLSAPQKTLSPKFFYDRRGSELFEAITELPEYYLTRAEREILGTWMPTLIPQLGTRTLVELGAGSGEKTALILDAAQPWVGAVYVPIDVSAEFLHETARRFRSAYPGLTVRPVVADITEPLRLPRMTAPVLFAFLGSTIGNFARPDAVRLLRRVRGAMRAEDRFLIGFDLRKDVRQIEAAYNDRQGVTAEFNRNALRVLNRELGADFDLDAFAHHAFYRIAAHRIEMHLVSQRRQRVTVPGAGVFDFEQGETIRTEISCKYDRDAIEAMLEDAGLRLAEWHTDAEGRFALVLAAVRA
jgi:L-histidine N-alpha-methyltransferase